MSASTVRVKGVKFTYVDTDRETARPMWTCNSSLAYNVRVVGRHRSHHKFRFYHTNGTFFEHTDMFTVMKEAIEAKRLYIEQLRATVAKYDEDKAANEKPFDPDLNTDTV